MHSGKVPFTVSNEDHDDVESDLESIDHSITIEQLQLDLFAAITEKASKNIIRTLKSQIQEFRSKEAQKQEVDEIVDLAAATIADLETSEQAAQKKLCQSKDNFDALNKISKSKEIKLHRLWTEVSEARKRIAKLEEENNALDDKLQAVEEDREKAKDQCEKLELELIKAKEEHFATKEIVLSDDNASNSLKSQLILAQERKTKLATEKEAASVRNIDLESELTKTNDRINELESDHRALIEKYKEAQVELILLNNLLVGATTTSITHNKCEPATEPFQSKRKHSETDRFEISNLRKMEQCQEDDQPEIQHSKDVSEDEIDVLKEIIDTEELELSRLWTEVSEARKQMAKLEEENASMHVKAHVFEEREQHVKDQYEELELELFQSQNELATMREAFGAFGAFGSGFKNLHT